jgi:cysteine protease ATG4
MLLTKMDPSCTLAFYCRSRAELTQLTQSVKEFVVPGHRHTDYPIFVFADGPAPNAHEAAVREERVLKVRHKYLDSQGNVEGEAMSEDFVLIS